MDPQPAFGIKEMFTQMVGDIARAVSEREGETKEQRIVRTQVAVTAIMGLLPRDAIEVMLAGRCLLFHELTVDSARDVLRGERDTATARRAARNGVVALDRAFGNNLRRFRDYQKRPDEGRRETSAPEVPDGAAATDAATESPAREEPLAATTASAKPPLLNRAARRAAKLPLRAAKRVATGNGAAIRARAVAGMATGGIPVESAIGTAIAGARAGINGTDMLSGLAASGLACATGVDSLNPDHPAAGGTSADSNRQPAG